MTFLSLKIPNTSPLQPSTETFPPLKAPRVSKNSTLERQPRSLHPFSDFYDTPTLPQPPIQTTEPPPQPLHQQRPPAQERPQPPQSPEGRGFHFQSNLTENKRHYKHPSLYQLFHSRVATNNYFDHFEKAGDKLYEEKIDDRMFGEGELTSDDGGGSIKGYESNKNFHGSPSQWQWKKRVVLKGRKCMELLGTELKRGVETLEMGGCFSQQPLPADLLHGMHRLRTLSLWGNSIKAFPDDFLKHSLHLQELLLWGNDISDLWLFGLSRGKLKRLRVIDLDYNSISRLTVAANNVIDRRNYKFKWKRHSGRKKLSSLFGSRLEVLKVGHNRVRSLAKDSFRDLKRLKHLSLNSNHLEYVYPGAFKGMQALVFLDLANNLVQYLADGVFASLSSLRELKLQKNRLKMLWHETFRGLSALQHIDLSNNRLHVLSEGIFKNSPGLVSISLSGNHISHLPACFNASQASHPHLKFLNLHHNPVKCSCALLSFLNDRAIVNRPKRSIFAGHNQHQFADSKVNTSHNGGVLGGRTLNGATLKELHRARVEKENASLYEDKESPLKDSPSASEQEVANDESKVNYSSSNRKSEAARSHEIKHTLGNCAHSHTCSNKATNAEMAISKTSKRRRPLETEENFMAGGESDNDVSDLTVVPTSENTDNNSVNATNTKRIEINNITAVNANLIQINNINNTNINIQWTEDSGSSKSQRSRKSAHQSNRLTASIKTNLYPNMKQDSYLTIWGVCYHTSSRAFRRKRGEKWIEESRNRGVNYKGRNVGRFVKEDKETDNMRNIFKKRKRKKRRRRKIRLGITKNGEEKEGGKVKRGEGRKGEEGRIKMKEGRIKQGGGRKKRRRRRREEGKKRLHRQINSADPLMQSLTPFQQPPLPATMHQHSAFLITQWQLSYILRCSDHICISLG